MVAMEMRITVEAAVARVGTIAAAGEEALEAATKARAADLETAVAWAARAAEAGMAVVAVGWAAMAAARAAMAEAAAMAAAAMAQAALCSALCASLRGPDQSHGPSPSWRVASPAP